MINYYLKIKKMKCIFGFKTWWIIYTNLLSKRDFLYVYIHTDAHLLARYLKIIIYLRKKSVHVLCKQFFVHHLGVKYCNNSTKNTHHLINVVFCNNTQIIFSHICSDYNKFKLIVALEHLCDFQLLFNLNY